MRFFKYFLADSRGITAIEYGLIAGVLSLGIMTAVTGVASEIKTVFNSISTTLKH